MRAEEVGTYNPKNVGGNGTAGRAAKSLMSQDV